MNSLSPSLDTIVAAAIVGDREAVERLFALIRPRVVQYCRARVGRQERSYASADDVAQEVCIAVLTLLPTYRDLGRPFLAFVYGIAAHKVADAHRSAARNRSEPVAEFPDAPELEDGPEQRAMRGELSARMARLISALPPKQREVLVLRVGAGLSAEETAAVVGLTPGGVRAAQHRGLTRLRKLMYDEAQMQWSLPTRFVREDEITTKGSYGQSKLLGTNDPYIDKLLHEADMALAGSGISVSYRPPAARYGPTTFGAGGRCVQ